MSGNAVRGHPRTYIGLIGEVLHKGQVVRRACISRFMNVDEVKGVGILGP